MYEIMITRRFAAAHQLRGYEGQCENLHGHTFRVEVKAAARRLNRLGLVLDFRELRKLLDQVLSGLDHQLLNELPPFRSQNPSSENLARYIYRRLQGGIRSEEVKIREVTVWESEDSAAAYRPG